ncbi:MAG TPA: ABC transporter permease subunit [Dehalococcoidia bacterium]|nr:ABC transporter permease subunit [Dehalococcoidia bacterium]
MPSLPAMIIARLTLQETVRRRLVWAVFLLTILIVALTGFGFSRLNTFTCAGAPCPAAEIRLAAAFFSILVAYMFDSVIAVGSSFVAALAIAADIESGVMLALLPRPIRRSDVVLGKWLGLVALIASYAIFAYSLQFAAVWLAVRYLPPQPIAAALYVTAQGVVLMTLALLLSTRLTAITVGIVAVVLFGVAWIAGIAQALGVAFENTVLTNVGTIISLLLPTDALWRNAIFNLEPIAAIAAAGGARFLAANPFFVAMPPPTAYVYWAIGWTVAVLGLGVYSFQRRDL